MLNRPLDSGEHGFEDGISAAQYQSVAKASKATAPSYLSDQLEKGCVERLLGIGHSTRGEELSRIHQPLARHLAIVVASENEPQSTLSRLQYAFRCMVCSFNY